MSITEKPHLVLVDDEQRMLTVLTALFRREYQIFSTTDGYEAIEYIKNNQVHVIISDQRMPILPGVEVLEQVKEASPNTIRLLLTGYADLQATIDSVNKAEVFRYINKPWSNARLKEIVAEATTISKGLFDGEQSEIPVASIPNAKSALVVEQVSQKHNEQIQPTLKRQKQPASSVTPQKTEEPVDTEKHALSILVIDDVRVAKKIEQLVKNRYKVFQARKIDSAFLILENENINMILSEIKEGNDELQIMLERLKQEYPQIITIILSHTTDSQFVAQLINHAQIYRFLPKQTLKTTILLKSIEAGMKQHLSLTKKPSRLQQYKVEQNENVQKETITNKVLSFFKRLGSKKT